jgi:hypothetical protein
LRAYPNSEYGRLRKLVAETCPGLRLRKGKRDGLFVLTDDQGAIEAEGVTVGEVRRLCMGVLTWDS